MKNLRKYLAILTVGIMVFGLVGCSSKSDNDETTTPTVAPTTAADTDSTDTSDSADTTDSTDTADSITGTITGSGSSALLPLAQDAADKFSAINTGVTITLNAGGSGTGLKEVADGTVDIGNSDVAAEEKLEAAQASALVDHKVAVIAMAPIANKDITATVTSLTKQQLTDVFTAKVTNWKEVGGPDEAIVLVTRPTTSGTRALFKEFALDGNEEASNAALETDDSGTLIQTVSSQAGAIGYVALSYLVNNDSVGVIGIDGVQPSLENTYNGTYPVWGYEHMYTNGEADGAVKAYLDYIVSDEYAPNVEAMGYCVISKMTVTR